MDKKIINKNDMLDFYGHETLDCDVCDKFSNVAGTPTYTVTPDDYETMIDEYKASGTKKTFNDWAATDSSKAYAKSGSSKPFKDWLNKDSTKGLLSAAGTLAATYLAGQNIGKEDVLDKDRETKEEKTILGLSPVNFGITVAVVSVLAIVGVIWYAKTHKK